MSEVNLDKIVPNSHTYKEQVEKEKIKPVVSGKVIKKDKTAKKKFAEIFFSEDIPDVKEYLLYDLIIPSIKQVFVDTLQNTIDLIFWGKIRGKSSSRISGGYTSYSSYSQPRPRSSRANYDCSEIIFENRDEAETVLDTLREIIDRYGKITVADFYETCGVTGNGYTDEDYGWRDLRDARVVRTREGYILDMPRCVQLR